MMRTTAPRLAAPLLVGLLLAGCATDEWVERQYGGSEPAASASTPPPAQVYRPQPPAAAPPQQATARPPSSVASTPPVRASDDATEVRRLPESTIENSRPVGAPGLPPGYRPSVAARDVGEESGVRVTLPPTGNGDANGRFIVESER